MAKKLEFYFDVASPPSWIAHERLPDIIRRTGAALTLRPVLVGAIIKLTGNTAPVAVPAKRTYMMEVDLPRQARQHNVTLNFAPGAPFNSLNLMRGALIADDLGRLADYAATIFRATWAEARDMSEPLIVSEVLDTAGFDAPELFDRAQDPAIKSRLVAANEKAVARGVFGVPTFFVGPEMFFGQDRLDLVEQILGPA